MKCRVMLLLFVLVASVPAQAQTFNALAGMQAYNRGDIPTAFRLLKAAADAGDPEGEVNLGYMYARGQGVAADQAEAFRLYGLSAAQGDGEGMNALGYKYQFGSGVRPDIDKAIHWYCNAIVVGNPRAMNNLAHLLYRGEGSAQDVQEARSLWEQASSLGHTSAMMNLSILLSVGSVQDQREGTRWLFDAAQHGNPRAILILQSHGYRGRLPAPFDEAAMMISSVNNPPGHAKICGLAA